jgi:hypothetical protein
MPRVVCHHCQVVQQSGRGDLLVQRIFGVRCTQPAPPLGRIGIERQDVLRVIGKDGIEPTVEEVGLTHIATMPDKLDAAPQFPDRYCGEPSSKRRIGFADWVAIPR